MANTCSRVIAMDEVAGSKQITLLQNIGLITPETEIDEKRLVLPGYFGSPMIAQGERRRSSNPRVTNFTDILDYSAGDAMLLVGYRRLL